MWVELTDTFWNPGTKRTINTDHITGIGQHPTFGTMVFFDDSEVMSISVAEAYNDVVGLLGTIAKVPA
jgi:hypothetical protein